MITDLGWRLELRTDSHLGLGRLLAVGYHRSREGDWMVSTRAQREPWSVPTKDAARGVLEAYKVAH